MSKIITFKEVLIRKTREEIEEILESLEEDYGVEVKVSKEEIKVLLEEFYNYYARKEIIHSFFEMMTGHMEDIAIMATEEDIPVDIDFILEQMKLLELLDSPIEVIPKETRKVVKKIRKTLEGSGKPHEREYH